MESTDEDRQVTSSSEYDEKENVPTVEIKGQPVRLAPLDGGGDRGPKLRDYERGDAAAVKSAIISMPDGDNPTSVVEKTEPIKTRHVEHVGQGQSSGGNTLDMVIYFQDKTGVHLKIDDGQHYDASQIFEIVLEEMSFGPQARDVFSLWLVSDLLELQLKPNHIPFKLVCFWEELLEKYTTAETEDIQRDEPVIMFQKNVFYPLSKEMEITDKQMVYFLYHEAKENVVDGRYPLEKDEYHKLAGLQALLQYTSYQDNMHDHKFYKDKLIEYYPVHMRKAKYRLPGVRSKDCSEYHLADQHQDAYRHYGITNKDNTAYNIQLAYLKFCRKKSFYGSAFFRGQIEHPGKKLLQTRIDDPVFIAINTEGINVIDMDDCVYLFGLKFHQARVEYAEPKDKNNPDCIPCIFLQFDVHENDEKVSKLLQVFSREAVLMDGMVEACKKLKNDNGNLPVPMSGGAGILTIDDVDETDGEKTPLQRGSEDIWAEFNRLCLATFDSKGNLMRSQARLSKSKNAGSRRN